MPVWGMALIIIFALIFGIVTIIGYILCIISIIRGFAQNNGAKITLGIIGLLVLPWLGYFAHFSKSKNLNESNDGEKGPRTTVNNLFKKRNDELANLKKEQELLETKLRLKELKSKWDDSHKEEEKNNKNKD